MKILQHLQLIVFLIYLGSVALNIAFVCWLLPQRTKELQFWRRAWGRERDISMRLFKQLHDEGITPATEAGPPGFDEKDIRG